MEIENPDPDWCIEGPLQQDDYYHRVRIMRLELRDFGRDIGIVVENEFGRMGLALNREQAQKLFNQLWDYNFRSKVT